MQGEWKAKKLPPVPKFQSKADQKLQAKLQDFLKETKSITQATDKVPQVKPIDRQPEQTAVPPENKKKLALSSLNSKLNSMLNAKKISLSTPMAIPSATPSAQPLVQVQRESIPDKITNNNDADLHSRNKDEDQQYDPNYPNNYQTAKNSRLALWASLADHQDDHLEDIKEEDSTYKTMMDIQIERQSQIEQLEEQLEEREEIALRMMQKYGYKVGEGLGKQSQGIRTPLIAKKTTDTACIIEPSSISLSYFISPQASCKSALIASHIQTTPILMIESLLTQSQIGQPIEQDLKQGCKEYGNIKAWLCFMMNSSAGNIIRIFIEYSTKEEAFAGFVGMNNKYFMDRLVSARFFQEQQWKQRILNAQVHPHIIT